MLTVRHTVKKSWWLARGLAAKPAAGDPMEVTIKVQPIPRPNEETEVKRARLLYQSRKRGILESDLLLSQFAKRHLPNLTRPQLEEYDKLLDEEDWDIYYWATNAEGSPKPCPPKWDRSEMMALVREIAANKEHKIMRMPDLE